MVTHQPGGKLYRVICWLTTRLPRRTQPSPHKWLPAVDKHMVYYDLRAALQDGTCSVCDLVAQATARRLRFLFHECITDPGVRMELRASLGFCPRHASAAVQQGHALGIAMIYQDVVNQARSRLSTSNAKSPARSSCPECVSEREDETRYVRALANDLIDAEMQAAYAAGPGLCLRHLDMALAQSRAQVRAFLCMQEETKLGRLAWELGEFIRKSDFNHSHESMADERDSWLRALTKIAGRAPCGDRRCGL